MRKKILCTFLAAAMAAGLMMGCSSPKKADPAETTAASASEEGTESDSVTQAESGQESESTAGEDASLTYVKDNGRLVMGLDSSFPPMGFLDDSQEIVGFDIDVATEVAKRMGVELVLQPISWTAKELELSTKNIDCIWNGMTINEERQEKMTLSKSYMLNKQVIVVMADSEIQTMADLAGKNVVLQNGSTAQEAVSGNQDFSDSLGNLVMVEDNVKAMLDMKVGASDAVVMDEIVARYYTEMPDNQGQYRILEDTLSDEEYAIGFRKGEEALRDEIDRILDEMRADGALGEISTKWFGSDITL